MSCVESSQRVTKYILLGLLCLDFVFSATIETTQRLGDEEIEGIYGEYEDEGNGAKDGNVLHRYKWDHLYTHEPTRDYEKGLKTTENVFLYVYVAIGILCILGLIGLLIYRCRGQYEWCSSEPDSSASTLESSLTATVHPPPQGGAGVNQQYTNGGVVYASEDTVSFVNPSYATPVQLGRQPDNTVASENPPVYTLVTITDLVSPTQPAFPVVKKENETPPGYGKGNKF